MEAWKYGGGEESQQINDWVIYIWLKRLLEKKLNRWVAENFERAPAYAYIPFADDEK